MRKIQKISIVGGTVGVLMAGGVAFAAWTSTGTDTGTVSAGSEQGLTVTAGSASGLYPTGYQTFNVDVKNKNPYKVAINGLEITDVRVENGGSDTNLPDCAASDVTAVVNDSGAGTGIAAGDTVTVQNAIKVTMHADASGNCQGADFKVDVKATADSSN